MRKIVTALIMCTILQCCGFTIESNETILNPRSYLEIAKQYLKNERYNNSIKICREILKTDPENYAANLLLSKNYYELDQLGPAAAALKKALELQPADENLKNFQLDIVSESLAKAEELYNSKRYDKAIALLLKSTALKPDALLSQILLGSCYKKNGNYTWAIDSLKKALEIEPGSRQAQSLLTKIIKEIDLPIKLTQKSKTKKGTDIITALSKVIGSAKLSKTIITDESWSAEPGTLESNNYSVYFTCKEDVSGTGSNFKSETFAWLINTKGSTIQAKNKNAQVLLERW